ncbi:MAG: hypothetical protein NC337_14715 [Roseburia sp.]|nr:hypothetical protein [Roseburia sp.]
MNTGIKNTITAADIDAQYDEKAKRLLSHKSILAHILVNTVNEFKGMKPGDVEAYIEGEPSIGSIPTEPGLTNTAGNTHGERIIGFNSENTEINEGLIRFDIVFYVRMPHNSNIESGLSQIIVNMEIQKSVPSEYDILNRAIFYVSRLLSSQKGRDFEGTRYNDIKRVYSIWICLNMDENCMEYVHLTKETLLGNPRFKGKLDLLNIILLGISDKLPEHTADYELHRLLSVLLSKELPIKAKLNILEQEYDIPMESNIRKDVNVMSNLGQGIREWGREEGRAEKAAAIILNMHRKGFTLEQIADATDMSIEDITAIISGKSPVLA